ncbi:MULTISPECIES: hypothetical protein [Peribacillus]|uniref:hypothetical protein n=1 Tax=Peribacillus frigoritolerans TaxID=450367 RepID=UPI003DA003C3
MNRDEKKKPVKKPETFSRRDLEELMNMKAPTYTKGHGGAIDFVSEFLASKGDNCLMISTNVILFI